MGTTSTPTLTNLSFPKVIDLTNGPQQITFIGTAQDNSGGAGIKSVTIFFDKNIDSRSGFPTSNFSLGKFSGIGTVNSGFTFTDSFTDNTPNTANSLVTLTTANSPGNYTISQIEVVDIEGHFVVYSNAQLKTLGINTSFSIVNAHAPNSPTESITTNVRNYVSGNTPIISGTAVPGSLVNVSGILDEAYGRTSSLTNFGSVKADGNGHWSLQTYTLRDGLYHDVTAKAIDVTGNGSAPSLPMSFNVKAHLPDAPLTFVSKDIHNHVTGTHPAIFGTSEAGSTITLYEGAKVLGTVLVNSDKKFGVATTPLEDGNHSVIAVVTDGNGNVASSTPLNFNVNKASLGFTFSIASVKDESAIQHDLPGYQLMIQRALDEVGARLSNIFDGQEDIAVNLILQSPKYYAAAAGGNWIDAVQTKGHPTPPIVGPATLFLPVNSDAAPDLTFNSLPENFTLLAHEMLHVMGISGKDVFASFTKNIGGKLYFNGPNATAINGGMVALADLAHLLDPNDIIGAGGVTNLKSPFISFNNPNSPFSNVDIAILKDIGFTNKFAIVSNSGHTFIPGNGLPGNNLVNGSVGIDTLVFTSPRSNFSVIAKDGLYNIIDNVGNGGTEILSSIERVMFGNTSIALDLTGNAGQAFRLYQAAFDRKPDLTGLGYWINDMDKGSSLTTVAGGFFQSAEFQKLYGTNPDTTTLLTNFYHNILHRAPDQSGFDYWANQLNTGLISPAGALASFAESAENQIMVIGSIQNGIEFAPWLG